MAKKTTEPASGQIATAEPPVSGNITLAQLGQRMSKGRKAASEPDPAKAATSTTSSEQAEGDEAKTDLSQTETESSAALAADATTAETGPDEGRADADDSGAAVAGDSDTAESEGAPATDDEAETEEPLPKSVRDLQKRVNKLTAKNAELQANLKEREEHIAKMQSGNGAQQAPLPHPADNSMGADNTMRDIDQQLAGIEAFLVWAEENPDGGSFTEGDKNYSLTGEDIRSYRRRSEAERVRLNARREARMETMRADFDQRRAAAHQQAVKLYPWVEQKGTPEFQEALAVIRSNPSVLDRADFELVVARQVVGHRLEREALKKNGKAVAKPGRAATPVVTFSPSSARKVDAPAATVSAAEKRFRDGGGKESDLSKLLAQRRLARIEAAKG